MKVPSAHCDSRVRTVRADVMTMMKQQARAMSPQVRILDCFCGVIEYFCLDVMMATTTNSLTYCL